MSNKPTLFASAGSLEGIKASITRFYGGEEKILEKLEEGGRQGKWILVQPSGKRIEGVQVRKTRGRYRFEGV